MQRYLQSALLVLLAEVITPIPDGRHVTAGGAGGAVRTQLIHLLEAALFLERSDTPDPTDVQNRGGFGAAP